MRISINTSGKMSMEDLWRLTLKYCFDSRNFFSVDEDRMRESCFLWHRYIEQFKEEQQKRFGFEFDPRPIGTKGTYIDEIEFYLGIICYHIDGVDNQRTWMVNRKATYAEHKIDYKKAYKLTGSWTKEDFVRAMKALKRNMEDQPEMYR